MSLLYPGMPRRASDQPGMAASSFPSSMTATPSPSSNHSGSSVPGSIGGRPSGSFVCPDGMMGACPASIRLGSGLAGAGT